MVNINHTFERLLRFCFTKPRQASAGLIVLIFLIFSIGWFIQYMNTGSITISTNSPDNLVEINPLSGKGSGVKSKGSLHARLGAGQYRITVGNHFTSSSRVIGVVQRKTFTYAINLQNIIEPEPVISFGAASVYTNASSLFYIDMRDRYLYKVAGGGTAAKVSADIKFSDIKWRNDHYGVGRNTDRNKLYQVTDGLVSQIDAPAELVGRLSYDLTPSGLIVSDSKSIYGQVGGAFHKLFSVNDRQTIVSASTRQNNVLVQLKTGSKEDGMTFEIVTYEGKIISSKENVSSYDYSWSPDGQQLAITSGSSTDIYDSALKPKSKLPDSNVLGLTWLNNDVLLYGVGSNLFSYDSLTKTSNGIAVAGSGRNIVEIYPSQDLTQIYVLSVSQGGAGDGSGYSLSRISLHNTVASYLYMLGIFLPTKLDQCYVDYLNFSHPIVEMYAYSPLGVDSCQQAVKKYLSHDKVDISKLDFYIGPLQTSSD